MSRAVMSRMPVNPRLNTTPEQRAWEYENFEYVKTVLHPARIGCFTIWSARRAEMQVPKKIQRYSLGLDYVMDGRSSRYIARRHLRVWDPEALKQAYGGPGSWLED